VTKAWEARIIWLDKEGRDPEEVFNAAVDAVEEPTEGIYYALLVEATLEDGGEEE
jgi:hypothetical protein